jgi:hypothetical protein
VGYDGGDVDPSIGFGELLYVQSRAKKLVSFRY